MTAPAREAERLGELLLLMPKVRGAIRMPDYALYFEPEYGPREWAVDAARVLDAFSGLLAERAALVEALKPLVELAVIYESNLPDGTPLPDDYVTEAVTLGDCRRARALVGGQADGE
jgi:hypothetical protein